MKNKHLILLIPSADDEIPELDSGVLACAPGLNHLSYEGKTAEDALAGLVDAIEDYQANVRNVLPPYSNEDFIRDEIMMRLLREERRIIRVLDAADPDSHQISEADARTMCNALLRLLGRR